MAWGLLIVLSSPWWVFGVITWNISHCNGREQQFFSHGRWFTRGHLLWEWDSLVFMFLKNFCSTMPRILRSVMEWGDDQRLAWLISENHLLTSGRYVYIFSMHMYNDRCKRQLRGRSDQIVTSAISLSLSLSLSLLTPYISSGIGATAYNTIVHKITKISALYESTTKVKPCLWFLSLRYNAWVSWPLVNSVFILEQLDHDWLKLNTTQ